MDPLLILLALWVLYGLAIGVRRLLAGRRPRPTAGGVPRRPPVGPSPAARSRTAPPRRPGDDSWGAPSTEVTRPAPPGPPTPAPAADWRRRLADPAALRDAIVAAEILRRPGSARRPAG